MKIRNSLLNISIGLLTFAIGLGWLGVYKLFRPSPSVAEPVIAKTFSNVETEKQSNDRETEFAIDKAVDLTDRVEEAAKDAAEKAVDAVKDAAKEEAQKPVSDEEFFTNLDISGYYKFVSNRPTEFKDFSLEIWLGEYYEEAENLEDNFTYGYIISNQKHFEFEFFQFAKRTLSFSTFERDGIKFVFSGKYERIETSNTNENLAVLKGTLLKRKNGKTLKKSKVEFSWILGC